MNQPRYLILNLGTGEIYERTTLEAVAFIVENDRTFKGRELEGDISWSVRRTGRWDRNDGLVIVIPQEPQQEE
jgi:hypothetical protein